MLVGVQAVNSWNIRSSSSIASSKDNDLSLLEREINLADRGI